MILLPCDAKWKTKKRRTNLRPKLNGWQTTRGDYSEVYSSFNFLCKCLTELLQSIDSHQECVPFSTIFSSRIEIFVSYRLINSDLKNDWSVNDMQILDVWCWSFQFSLIWWWWHWKRFSFYNFFFSLADTRQRHKKIDDCDGWFTCCCFPGVPGGVVSGGCRWSHHCRVLAFWVHSFCPIVDEDSVEEYSFSRLLSPVPRECPPSGCKPRVSWRMSLRRFPC